MRRTLILFVLVLSFSMIFIGSGIAVSVFNLRKELPDHLLLSKYHPILTTRFYSKDGSVLCENAVENRFYVSIETVPKLVINAFLAAEDKNFKHHRGISPLGIVSASIVNIFRLLMSKRPVGRSTITQQVARNLLLQDTARVVSYKRKIKEIILASRIEKTFSKDYILELYLNEIFFGGKAYGIVAAALAYFNKSLDELNIVEVAFLAGLPKAPSRYNPIHDYSSALKRRNYVIGRMANDGYITRKEATILKREQVKVLDFQEDKKIKSMYFLEEARRELLRRYRDRLDPRGGLVIQTTLDSKVQNIAERVLRGKLIEIDQRNGWRGAITNLHLSDGELYWKIQNQESKALWYKKLTGSKIKIRSGDWMKALVLEIKSMGIVIGLDSGLVGLIPLSEIYSNYKISQGNDAVSLVKRGDIILVEKRKNKIFRKELNSNVEKLEIYKLRQIPEVSGGLIVMEAHTGRVLALQGGYSFSVSQYNRATQAMRQIGSVFKLFVYLAAIEQGKSLSSIILDAPLSVDLGSGLGIWHPGNWDREFMGLLTLRRSFEMSRNIAAIRLIRDQIGIGRVIFLARKVGVVSDLHKNLSIILGVEETTLAKLVTSFAGIVNGGKRVEPIFLDYVQDRYGRILKGCKFSKDETRESLTDRISSYKALSLLQGAVERGTSKAILELRYPVAGKTGTTSNYYDSWFVGFSAGIVVGTYVGYDLPRTLGVKQYASVVALPIVKNLMQETLKNELLSKMYMEFFIPRGIQLLPVNVVTGKFTSSRDPLMVYEAFGSKYPLDEVIRTKKSEENYESSISFS